MFLSLFLLAAFAAQFYAAPITNTLSLSHRSGHGLDMLAVDSLRSSHMLIGRGGNGSKGQGGSRRKSAPPAPERVHGPEIIDETYWIKTVKKAQSIHDTYDKDNEEQAFIIFLLDQKETEFRGVLQRVMNSSSIHILVRETAEDENPWTPIVEAVTRVTQKLMFLTDDQKREIQDAIDQVSVPCRDYMKVTAQWDSRLENGHDWVDAFLMQSAIEKLR